MPSNQKIQKIFSEPDVKHGLSLFSVEEINVIERLIIEQDGKFFIKCQIRDKYKSAKPEEIVRQLWIYRLLSEYGYPKERIDVERIIYFGTRVEPGAAVFHPGRSAVPLNSRAHHHVPGSQGGRSQSRRFAAI